MRIVPPSLPPHHSDPATRDFQSSIPVEALLRGCHLDVQCLLQQQSLSSAAVQYCGLLPVDRMVTSPTHVPLQLTSPSSPSRRRPGVPSALSPVSVWSPRCRPGRSCRGYDIPHWIVYQEVSDRLGGDHSTGPRQRTGIVAEGGTAHPDDTLGGALQPGWRTGSPRLLDRCDEEAGREEQSSPTFDLR